MFDVAQFVRLLIWTSFLVSNILNKTCAVVNQVLSKITKSTVLQNQGHLKLFTKIISFLQFAKGYIPVHFKEKSALSHVVYIPELGFHFLRVQ